MSVVLLVRHGQASWGAADYDQLSEHGYAQGRRVGEALAARGVVPARLCAGSMRRHDQTAVAAAQGAGWDLPIEVDEGWNEFDHLQMLAVHEPPGTPGAEMSKQEFQAWFEEASLRWVSGRHDEDYEEPFSDFTGRVEAALARLGQSLDSGETAVVFTSGGPISWAVTRLLGGGADIWTRLNPVTVNASVTKIVVGRRGTTLVSFNDHGHLEPDDVTYR